MNTRPSWYVIAAFIVCGSLARQAGASENPLVGRWLLERKGVDATMPYKLEWEFTTNEVVVRIVRGTGESTEASRNRYTIDTDKSPNWITVTLSAESPEIRRGIFRIVGDELDLKQAIGGGPRPEDFGPDDYSVLKRIGKPAGPANGSQPIGSKTNRTSSATGSRH